MHFSKSWRLKDLQMSITNSCRKQDAVVIVQRMLWLAGWAVCHYRYLYVTLLREPTARYLSEWKQVQRGSTWQSAQLVCDGRPATLDEVPFCFRGTVQTLHMPSLPDSVGGPLVRLDRCYHGISWTPRTILTLDSDTTCGRVPQCYWHVNFTG